MPRQALSFDTNKFINVSQVGGIDSYTIDEGPARGVRALLVNTGGGLRYRILVDRGMDIDQAFVGAYSLSFLTHRGATPPTRAFDRGLDWLKGFAGGLLTSCGPFNIGGPGSDELGEFGLHGEHSATAACIESIIQPDPHANSREMSVTGRLRYGSFYCPCVELQRKISSVLGENTIYLVDEFYNAGNQDAPHAWLLHINFGYPLLQGWDDERGCRQFENSAGGVDWLQREGFSALRQLAALGEIRVRGGAGAFDGKRGRARQRSGAGIAGNTETR